MSDHDQTKDPLGSNKIAGAVLTIALLFFGLPQIIDKIAGGGGHHGSSHDDHHEVDPENPLGLAYPIAFKVEGAPVVEKKEIPLGNLLAEASAAGGERAAAICKSCHTLDKGGANGTGPNLWNIVGRDKAAVAGFKYSGALTSFGGAWTYEDLDGYLNNSAAFMPGTSMVQKISKAPKRANILAYLQTLSDSPVAFPPPVAEESETATLENTDAATEVALGADDSNMMDIANDALDAVSKDAMMEKGEAMLEDAKDTMMDKVEGAVEDAAEGVH